MGMVLGGLLVAGIVARAPAAEDPSGAAPRTADAPTPAANDEPFTIHRDQVYATVDGRDLLADVLVPSGQGPFPAVLVIHGGAWTVGGKAQLRFAAERFARRGYVAVCIAYRLAPRYTFPAQIDDCRAALRWMCQQAERFRIDPRHIAAYGYSAGGHLAVLLGVQPQAARAASDAAPQPDAAPPQGNDTPQIDRAPEGDSAPHDDTPSSGGRAPADLPQQERTACRPESLRLCAVVAGGAPCDFRDLPPRSKMLEYWLGATRAEAPEIYRQASPRAWVSRAAPPMFLFHGENDAAVPRYSAEQLVRDLQALHVPARFRLVPDRGHVLTLFETQVLDEAIDFVDAARTGNLP
jgi:triacylglycerol lipase